MQRIAVVGPSASGKSTLARLLSIRLGVPWLELDSVFHQPDWTQLPDEEMRRRVGAFVAGDAWVVDGNYSQVRDLVLGRADTVVWLRPTRSRVLRQVLARTSGRLLRRQELWNGNRERLRNVLSRDPERSIVAWAWQTHGTYDERYSPLKAAAPEGQRWAELHDRRQVEEFLRQVTRVPEK